MKKIDSRIFKIQIYSTIYIILISMVISFAAATYKYTTVDFLPAFFMSQLLIRSFEYYIYITIPLIAAFLATTSSLFFSFEKSRTARKRLVKVNLYIVLFTSILNGFAMMIAIPEITRTEQENKNATTIARECINETVLSFNNQDYERAQNYLSIYLTIDDLQSSRFEINRTNPPSIKLLKDEYSHFIFGHKREQVGWNPINLQNEIKEILSSNDEITNLESASEAEYFSLKKSIFEIYEVAMLGNNLEEIVNVYGKVQNLYKMNILDSETKELYEELTDFILQNGFFYSDVSSVRNLNIGEDILFLNENSNDIHQVVSIDKIILLGDHLYGRDITIEELDSDGNSLMKLFSEYAKIENGRILFSGIDKDSATIINRAEFLIGKPNSRVNQFQATLNIKKDLLPYLEADVKKLNIAQLFEIKEYFIESHSILKYFDIEIIYRFALVISIFLLSLFAVFYGIKTKMDNLKYNFAGYLLTPVVFVATAIFIVLYLIFLKAIITIAFLNLGFWATIAIIAVVSICLFSILLLGINRRIYLD